MTVLGLPGEKGMAVRPATIVVAALLTLIGCDDGGRDVVGPGSGSGSGTSLTGENYVEEMNALMSQTGTLIQDINDLLSVWNATYNVAYADSKADSLLTNSRTIRTAAGRLTPSMSQRQVHTIFISMIDKISSALGSMRTYFSTRSDEALLNANVFLREADRLRKQFNEQI
jgi:hypothetical protein